ncbi:MAG: PAS domain S-box protein [Chloroflexaceae bacterium]|nr:PAS domain S-box protein [Chloroflexaceae bacterium]
MLPDVEQLEQQLALMQRQLQFVQEVARIGFWTWEVTTDIITWSPELEIMLGLEPGHLSGSNFEHYTQLVHPDDRSGLEQAVQHALSTASRNYRTEHRILREDGTLMWFDVRGRIEYTSDNQPLRIIGMVQDVTGHRQREEVLKKFFDILETATESVTTAPIATGTIDYVNPIGAQILGYSREEMIGLKVVDLFAHEPAYVESLMVQCIGQGIWKGELDCRHKDGYALPVHLSAHVLYSLNGQPEKLVGFVRDLTEQNQHETELRTFQTLVENAPDGIVISDAQGIAFYVNPAYERLVGCSAAEIYQRDTIPFLPPEEVERVIPVVTEALLTRGTWRGTQTILRADGSRFIAENTIFPIVDDQGQIQRVISIVRDITEQKQRETQLRTFQTLVENSPDAIVISDLENIVRYVNPAHRYLTGLDRSQVLHKNALLFLTEESIVNKQAPRRNDILQHGLWRGELIVQRIDRQQIVTQATIFLIQDEQGNPIQFSTILRDISEQKRQEAERAALQQQVIDGQQAAIRELSTPLLPIGDEIIALPLVGTIDNIRALQVMESLLEGVARHRATIAIVDITGVSLVDTYVAQALVQAAQAVQLLGAQVVLTGIQPQIAQTLVHLGVNLQGIVTQSTLQAGIAYALGRRERYNYDRRRSTA